ncbi:MAG: hypothetical protein HY598_01955 [Candidatus Omnitrophica bacterium]|nr:hypothetical protein [Candidatus Omnitrophota bacterium]
MPAAVEAVIAALKAAVPLEMRPVSNAAYLEATLSRQQLPRCRELLQQHFGAPVKEFGRPALWMGWRRRFVKRLGGIRFNQCLFLDAQEDHSAVYATLWPWSSDPKRITLKVGVVVE